MTADTLDIENRASLERYLAARTDVAGEWRRFQPLAGGVSSRTVLVEFADGRRWVLKQALPKLRVAADWFSDPRRIDREALGMQVLGELLPAGAVPRLVFLDSSRHVLAMEAVAEPHENWKTLLLAGTVDAEHFRRFGALLGALHRRSTERAAELQPQFADRTFFESLRVEPYYRFSAAADSRAAEFFHRLIADAHDNAAALVHGDFSPKNMLIHRGTLVVLDHEVIHWGDPAFDVGFALTHLLAKSQHVAARRKEIAAGIAEFLAAYDREIDRAAWNDARFARRCCRHALGCLSARVVGRSPLEYLSPPLRQRLREAVVRLLADVPHRLPELIARFDREMEKENG